LVSTVFIDFLAGGVPEEELDDGEDDDDEDADEDEEEDELDL
jgi:hypothetical protein